ncbi:hypothetical protein NCCP436_28790 [Pseudomonas sp. NCCP-436]|nr:hypothetical protein NCCP436_28790 [Pseudomonas sp. NCCP-436]
MPVVFVEQVEHGAMAVVLGGTDYPYRLVQHPITGGAAGLEQFTVQFDTLEGADFTAWVAGNEAVDPDATGGDQQATVLTTEAGQVAEKAIQAHDGSEVLPGGFGGAVYAD